MPKQCGKCKETKPLSNFYRDIDKKDKRATICKECKVIYNKQYLKTHRKQHNLTNKYWRGINKIIVLQIYSKGSMVCKNCGYNDIDALTIDHINGKGKQHRDKIKVPFYYWLMKNKFPKGYQVLCMNCQFIKKMKNKEIRYDK